MSYPVILRLHTLHLLVAAALVAGSPARSEVPSRFEELRRSIPKRLEADSIPSLSLAVAKDGRIVWQESFGFADLERRAAATGETLFPIASISKTLTATALMVLVQQGRLALDDPANLYLDAPGIQAAIGSARDVTLRRLASHTSGLARHDLYYYDDEPRPQRSITDRIRRYGRVVRTPGESYEYSNLGYQILAEIIARRSRRAYGDFLREAVFEPLGMLHTTVGRPRDGAFDVARSYDARRRPVPMREDTCAGAGGVYSTAADLARFGMLHVGRVSAGPPILSPTLLAAMRQPVVQTEPGAWYAIGWRVDREAFAVETIYHSGSNGASASILAFVPGEDLAVAVLANCVTTLPGSIAREVIASFGPRPAPATPRERSTPPPRGGVEPYVPTAAWTGRWEGAIQAPDGSVGLILDCTESGAILVRLGGARPDSAGGVRIDDRYLRGSFSGEVPNPDAKARRYRLHFKLKPTGDRLTGSVTAGSVAGERVITLSYWTELRRTDNVGPTRK